MATLAEYAAAAEAPKRRRKCFTCNLPADILAQVEEARRQDNPPAFTTIAAWLKEESHEVTMYNLRNHFQAGHQDDER